MEASEIIVEVQMLALDDFKASDQAMINKFVGSLTGSSSL